MVSIIPFEGICFCSNQNTSTIQVTKLFPMSKDDFWKGYELSVKRPYDFSICVPETQKLDDPIYYYIWLGEYILHKTNYTLKDLVDTDNLNCKYL